MKFAAETIIIHVVNATLHTFNGEFLRKDCSSAGIATCLGVCSYCGLKRTPLSSSLCRVTPAEQVW